MLEIESKRYGFKTKTIWFSDSPFDVRGYDAVTFHACTENVDLKGFTKREFTTLMIDLTRDLDAIWRNMSRTSCRERIKKAVKEGVKVRIDEGYEDFAEIHQRLRMAKGLPVHEMNTDFLKKYGTLFVSVIDGEIMGGQFFLRDDRHMRWLFNASRRLESGDAQASVIGAANRLLAWNAIQHGKNAGIETFDLGGYYTGEEPDPQMEGVNYFKSRFGGEIVTLYIYEKDYSPICTLTKRGNRAFKAIRDGIATGVDRRRSGLLPRGH
jgi:hypothetical protein